MKNRTLYLIVICLLAILAIVGCSHATDENLPMETDSYSSTDHDRIYTEACELIWPYMQLEGVRALSPDSKQSREELNRGISLLRTVVEIKPTNSSAYWVMGKAYQALDQSEDACDAFGEAFAIGKDNPDIAREYMLECLNLGRASDAIDAAEHGVSLKPDDAGLVANLAIAYLVGGRVNDALTTVNRSLTLSPDDKVTLHVKKLILEVRDGKRPQPNSAQDLE